MTASTQELAPTTSADPVQSAKDALVAAREVVEGWRAKAAEAQADLDQLEATAGDRILADPDAAEEIESALTTHRLTVRAAKRAEESAMPAVVEAEAAYLNAEAGTAAAAAEVARGELVEHQAKTDRLLAQLERHEGEFVSRGDMVNAVMRVTPATTYAGAAASYKTPKSAALRRRVAAAEVEVRILRDLAQGLDPRGWMRSTREQVSYPACLTSVDALVRPPEHRDQAMQLERVIVELEACLVDLPRDIERVRDERARGLLNEETMQTQVARFEARLAEIPDELEQAKSNLSRLGVWA